MRIITTHKNADFDAFASLMAASVIYPDAVPVLPKTVNPNVKAFLSIHKDLFITSQLSEIDQNEVDSLIIVDASSWKRLEKLKKLKEKKKLEVIIWDHHTEGDIKSTWECVEETGAAVTLLVHEIIKNRKLITPIMATLFLIGIYEDTGNLTFSSTTSLDVSACAFLLDRKADLNVMNSFLRQTYGERQKKILFEMMDNAIRKTINGYRLCFSIVDIQGHISNLSVVVSMFRGLENVDGAFGIFVDEKKCIIIGRSGIDGLDIGKLMRNIGGGGHPGAGSAQIKSEFLQAEAVVELLCELIEGNQRSSISLSDIMSYPVYFVSPKTTMEDLGSLLREKGCTGVPVVENDCIIGVISRRDFKKIRKTEQMQSPVKAFMSPEVKSISSDKSPLEAARMMIKYDIGRVPVTDNNKMIGIITRTDTMRFYYDLLPD
jgi:nanoRNase/pAp phosphatase (c-di-AMP/oligoRNAs hydrolase)